MKKLRGAIDPYTLGFLLSLIGAAATHIAHMDDDEPVLQAEEIREQTKTELDDDERYDE